MNLDETIAVLEVQRAKLRDLHREYYSAFDAAFDEGSAHSSLQRWAERTGKLIHEHLGQPEVVKFRNAVGRAPRGRGSWAWGELCQCLDTHLLRLIQDVAEYPDDFISAESENARQEQMVAKSGPLQFDVFLSYATADKDEAREIHGELTRRGKKCFLSEKTLKPGDRFSDEIRNAIVSSKEVWILVSPNSNKSAWVQREVSAAWALSKHTVPILFRCSPGDLPDILDDAHAIGLPQNQ